MKSLQILLVDDENSMCMLLESIVKKIVDKKTDLTVITAADGIEAMKEIEKPNNGPFDMIFLDIEMPKQDGFTTLEQIKEKVEKPYVIVVTGASTSDNIRNAMDAGANDIIVKPFSVKRVTQALDKFLNSRV